MPLCAVLMTYRLLFRFDGFLNFKAECAFGNRARRTLPWTD